VWFEVGQVASFYQAGRDLDPQWNGAGSVLKARAIQSAIERGNREIDLLHGDEAYKYDWVSETRTVHHLRGSHGLAAEAALGARRLRQTMVRVAPHTTRT
jgi:CelD/BcsL family acetyltransferase involved in cellulose biosynthesis